MNLTGSASEIMAQLSAPGVDQALERAAASIRFGKMKRAVLPYQAAALYTLAQPYDGGRILEIGTYYGYSAAVLAQAAPRAKIITLNPTPWEAQDARANLAHFENVSVVERYSWDYLEMLAPDWMFDMIFVDGDHKAIKRDLPYWARLREGGLIVFHDFSPNGSARACPPVYRALAGVAAHMGREFDVLVIDDEQIGMAGYYKRAGDPAWSE